MPLVLALSALLGGCGARSDQPVENQPAEADVDVLPPDESTVTNANGVEPDSIGSQKGVAPDAESAPSRPVIPAQYRGRWGMVPADCDRSRSDAKGALTIGNRTLTFYESRGTLRERRPAAAASFSGLFDFTGEGMTWEKVITFTLAGDRLVRADDEGRYSYTRCAR